MKKIKILLFMVTYYFIIQPEVAHPECSNLISIDHGDRVEVVCTETTSATENLKPAEGTSTNELRQEIHDTGISLIDDTWSVIGLGSFDAHSINNSTEIAGDIIGTSGERYAGVWKKGFVEKLDASTTMESSAKSINDSGSVVGYQKTNGTNITRAFFWDKNVAQIISFELKSSRALVINNSGEVLGDVLDEPRDIKIPFLWKSGAMQLLVNMTKIIGINNNGQILAKSGNDIVLWQNGSTSKITVPEEDESTKANTGIAKPSSDSKKVKTFEPILLNDEGQIIVLRDYDHELFIWQHNRLRKIDKLNSFTLPSAINQKGTIVGLDSNHKAFILKNDSMAYLHDYFDVLKKFFATSIVINDHDQMVVSDDKISYLISPSSKVPILISGKNKEAASNTSIQKRVSP